MNPFNKNIREQRTARTARLKSKIDTTTKQVQQLNHKYFEIPLPQHFHTESQHQYLSSPNPINKKQISQNQVDKEVDLRKQNIKQKIKFRVKQELWNILKNNQEKLTSSIDHSTQSLMKPRKVSNSVSYIAGRSFTRFSRTATSKNNWTAIQRSKVQNPPEKENDFLEAKQIKRIRHRRGWSSVKMRDKDRLQIQKNQVRINKSAVYIEKFDNMKIQPWKSPEDPENNESSQLV